MGKMGELGSDGVLDRTDNGDEGGSDAARGEERGLDGDDEYVSVVDGKSTEDCRRSMVPRRETRNAWSEEDGERKKDPGDGRGGEKDAKMIRIR